MSKLLAAVRFKNLDEARRVLQEVSPDSRAEIFDDAGAEPQGLLAAVPEDRVNEEVFSRLFEQKKGLSVKVEKIEYSGYGPPAEEENYMGFVSENVAYVLEGCRLPIEIVNCPDGAKDLHHLEALVLDHLHPLNRDDLTKRLNLQGDWDFEKLFELISAREITAEQIDRMIHQGVQ